MNSKAAQKSLRRYADAQKAQFLLRFFKTGNGQYAEGDKFLGVNVPATRSVAQDFRSLPIQETVKLLRSPYHEDRLLALIILGLQYRAGDERTQEEIHLAYVANIHWVNNWDLVDTSARQLVGAYLEGRDRRAIHLMSRAPSLWVRRVAVIATFHFIKQGDFKDALKVCQALLGDGEDLIHKATGWMLREIGNRDRKVLEGFLDKHAHVMPRTMLRYSLEKLPAAERKRYMGLKVKSARKA